MKRNYYAESNVNQLLVKAETRVIELKIILIEAQLKALADMRRLYPTHRAAEEQPYALHTAALPS